MCLSFLIYCTQKSTVLKLCLLITIILLVESICEINCRLGSYLARVASVRSYWLYFSNYYGFNIGGGCFPPFLILKYSLKIWNALVKLI